MSTDTIRSIRPRPHTIVVFSDLWCSFAHVAVHRLHETRNRLRLDDTIEFDHHAFPLELFNEAPSPRPGTDSEVGGIAALEPDAGWHMWTAPDWSFPTSTLPALEAIQVAKDQSLNASATLDRALRRAFWHDNLCINNRRVILDVARRTDAVDTDALAAGLDDGRARVRISNDFRLAREVGAVCSPHLFLPDGSNFPNPGIEVTWNGDYGTGFPIVRSDDPEVYQRILLRAAPA